MELSDALSAASTKIIQKVSAGPPSEMIDGMAINQGLSPVMSALIDIKPAMLTKQSGEMAAEVESWARVEADKMGMDTVEFLKDILYRFGDHDRGEVSLERLHRFVSIRKSLRELHEEERALSR